jgi:hypothetical protein
VNDRCVRPSVRDCDSDQEILWSRLRVVDEDVEVPVVVEDSSVDQLAVLGRQLLDRHDALEPGIEGLVDLAHATSANSRFDFVRAETCAGCESQT